MSSFGYPGFNPGAPGVGSSNSSGYGNYWGGPGRSVYGPGSQYSVPLDPRSVQWDPVTGMPMIPGPVPGKWAVRYQEVAQRLTRQRQQGLWGDAQNVMRQAQDLLTGYRPGGSAALAAGIFGQRAGLYAQQAQSYTEPDLMSGYRQRQIESAQESARKYRDINTALGFMQASANVIGAVTGAGQAPAPEIGQEGPQAPQTPYAGGFTPQGEAGGSYSIAPGGGLARAPAPGQRPGAPGAAPAPGGGGMAARMPGPTPAGGGGPAPGGPGAPGPGGAGAGLPPSGGFGAFGMDGDFTPNALAASAARSSEAVGGIAQLDFARSPVRISSTNAMMMSARQRLLAAMAA